RTVPVNPLLASRIAALVDPHGSRRRGTPIPRLGVDARPEGNPAAGDRTAGGKGRLVGTVQISAERRRRLSRWLERNRHHWVPVVAGGAGRNWAPPHPRGSPRAPGLA